jgi:hypothetical protein
MRIKGIISFLLLSTMLLLNACKQEQPDWSGVITFTNPTAQTLVANGYDTVTLTAHINPNSDPDKRTITFTTDYGTFTNGQPTIVLNADQNGNATTAIKGTVVATATIKATIQTIFTATKKIYFVAADPSMIFKVNPITDSIPSDGVSTIAIGAVVNKALLITQQNMVFTTDGGTFGNGTATITLAADSNGNATAYLKSSTFGTKHVSLVNNNVTQVVAVNFIKALPDTILLSALSVLGSGYNNSLAIGIVLKRNVGSVSPTFFFIYNATDNSGNQVGEFFNGTASDQNGNASVAFTMGNSTYKGLVTITVALQQNPAIKAMVNVLIN